MRLLANSLASVARETRQIATAAPAARLFDEVADLLRASHTAYPRSITELENARFTMLRQNGVVATASEIGATTVKSHFKLSATQFASITNGFDRFAEALRIRDKSHSLSELKRAHSIFDRDVVPALRGAGVRVERSESLLYEGTHSQAPQVRLNPNFETVRGSFDLNTVGGMRRLVADQGDSELGLALRRITSRLGSPHGHGRSDAPLAADRKFLIFDEATKNPDLAKLRDPVFAERLANADKPIDLPLEIAIRFGTMRARGPSRRDVAETAFTKFEEVAHFYQFLNQGPLSRLGGNLQRAIDEGDTMVSWVTRNVKTPGQIEHFIKENEMLGVANELRLASPPSFRNGYSRSLLPSGLYY